MKILLTAINAKYIHSNLGIYSLKAYADSRRTYKTSAIDIGEYTINHSMDKVLQDLYERKPDMVGFSCYIWNIQYVLLLAKNLSQILPHTMIWLGGPEVSYDAGELLEREPEVTGIMIGEGEETFLELADYYEGRRIERVPGLKEQKKGSLESEELSHIRGIAFRDREGRIVITPPRPPLPMDRLPFCYGSLEGMEHRIIYYESSRGCPYSCSYCLSSIDRTVRFRSLELVKRELDVFLKYKVPQVKFVDRTFNCRKSHCMAVWRYLLEHDNKVTNFHFEVSADLLDQEQLELLGQMRPGLIQLEIGVQTTNEKTIEEIRRTMDLSRLKDVVDTIRGFHNIHQHLDLIAGLPYEDFQSFKESFDQVFRMRPNQLQLGFLKVLKGSHMARMAENYDLVFHREPPYEVLSTKWLSYGQVIRLKAVEEMVEVYYNSGQFLCTVKEMEGSWQSPYDMFEAIGNYYKSHNLTAVSHSRLARYEILFGFLKEMEAERTEIYRDLLMYDLYLRENVKSRPGFARDQTPFKAVIRRFFEEEAEHPRYLTGYEAYDSRQMSKVAHVEAMGDGRLVLFDYKNRDPLTYNARAVVIEPADKGEILFTATISRI